MLAPVSTARTCASLVHAELFSKNSFPSSVLRPGEDSVLSAAKFVFGLSCSSGRSALGVSL